MWLRPGTPWRGPGEAKKNLRLISRRRKVNVPEDRLCFLDESSLDGFDRNPNALRAAVGGLDADTL